MKRMRRLLAAYLVLFQGAFRTVWQLMRGIYKVSKLPHPIVTIFGGSRFKQDARYALQAHKLAHALIQSHISVITGGGPGIMQAASCGAREEMAKQKNRARTLGITVKGLDNLEPINPCVMDDYLITDFFFARKWLLMNYSVAFAVFPGGFGTLEELAEVLTLMQTKKMETAPIILIGVDYWAPLLKWLSASALENKLITQDELDLMRMTDDIDEAITLLKHRCQECAFMDQAAKS
jgi:uncharacterized protein (TIGR00730 family)